MRHKKTLKFPYHKNRLEATQIENKTNHLEKTKIDVDSPKEYLKNSKLILKTQQIFNSERIMFLLKQLIRLL